MRAFIVALALVAFGGCQLSQMDIARKSLNTAEALRQSAAQALDAADEKLQQDIISKAQESGDIAKAESDLHAWWKKRFDVDVALSALKVAISVGQNVLSAVEAGQQKMSFLAPALVAVQEAIAGVIAILGSIGVKL